MRKSPGKCSKDVEEEEQVGRSRYELRKRKKKDVALEDKSRFAWGAEDELKILTGILEYNRETCLDYNNNLKAFYDFIRGSLNAVVNKDQLKNKIRNLMDKYHSNSLEEANGKAHVFSDHEAEAYEQSQKIWGGKSVSRESQGEESVVPSDWILLHEKCLSQDNQIRILLEQLEAAEKKLEVSGMTEMELRTESLEQKKLINELRNKLGEAENKIIEYQVSGMTEMELRTESLEQKKLINELRNKLGEAENKIIEGEEISEEKGDA